VNSKARFLTIQARVLILVVLAMTPIVLERISDIKVGRAERLRLTETTLRGLSRQGAEVYAQTLSSARSLMRAAAVLFRSDDKIDPRTCGKSMEELTRGSEVVDALSIATSDGQIVCSNLPPFVGVQINDRSYFRAGIATDDFTVAGMLISRALGRPVVPAALPYRVADGALSVVVSSLNLSWIESLLSTVDAQNLTASIIDRQGNLIVRYPRSDTSVERNIADHDLFKRITSGHFEAFTAADLDGTSRVFAAAELGGDAFFVVGIDRAQIVSSIDRQIILAYAGVMAAIFFASLGAVWGSDRVILRPLRALADKAARYGQGDFTFRHSVLRWPPEFLPLNRVLDQMAQQLAAREHNLLEENRQLDHLAQIDGLTEPTGGALTRDCARNGLRVRPAGSRSLS
jgi:hypothetical protein